MVVKPFYMTGSIEGRDSLVSGGPRSKTGGMHIDIQQRSKGDITTAFSVTSFSNHTDGKHILVTVVRDHNNQEVARHETEY